MKRVSGVGGREPENPVLAPVSDPRPVSSEVAGSTDPRDEALLAYRVAETIDPANLSVEREMQLVATRIGK
jgi:hypothetical protein